MWPFHRSPIPPSLHKQLAALLDRIETLEHRVEHNQLEAEDISAKLHDQMRRLYGRIVKQQERESPTEERPPILEQAAYHARPVPSTAHLARRFKMGG